MTNPQEFRCEICENVLKSGHWLQNHLKNVYDCEEQNCDFCDKIGSRSK